MLWLWLTSPDILYKTELFKLNWIMLHNDLFIPKWKVSVQIQKVFDPISRKIALCNKWYFMMIYYYFPATARPWDSRFLVPKKWKNGPQKLLIISPDPLISQSSPDQRPTAQNWFFILRNLGTRHLFSYLCYVVGRIKGRWLIFLDFKYITDKRTDLWSRDFLIWRINSGLLAVGLGWTVK